MCFLIILTRQTLAQISDCFHQNSNHLSVEVCSIESRLSSCGLSRRACLWCTCPGFRLTFLSCLSRVAKTLNAELTTLGTMTAFWASLVRALSSPVTSRSIVAHHDVGCLGVWRVTHTIAACNSTSDFVRRRPNNLRKGRGTSE